VGGGWGWAVEVEIGVREKKGVRENGREINQTTLSAFSALPNHAVVAHN
jgi:hypothetical protein